MISPIMDDRSVLLIRCSKPEAQEIRSRAKLQRRTLSGYVLYTVMKAVVIDEMFLDRFESLPQQMHPAFSTPLVGQRTAMLLRCSREESGRIRAIAAKRDTTISGFVLYALRRAWSIADQLPKTALPGASGPKVLS